MMKRLEYLRGITEEECEALRGLGVRHSNQLLHATTLVIDRERIQRRAGIPVERLYVLGQQAALMEISGLERHLPLVMRLGITTLRQLAPMSCTRGSSTRSGWAALPAAPTSSTGSARHAPSTSSKTRRRRPRPESAATSPPS